MKTKITLLFACMAIVSCTKWHYGHGDYDDDNPNDKIEYEDIKVDEGVDNGKQIIFSPNEVIVRYKPGVEPEERAIIRADIENELSTFEYRECDCGDTNMELWIFDRNINDPEIEGVVQRLSRRSGTRGERSFDIQLSPSGPFTLEGQGNDGDENPLIVKSNVSDIKVNIAVIDTGLDFYRYLAEETPKEFLLPTERFGSCFPTDSGWNFTVNPGNGAFADTNGHGTYVTKIITDELDDKGLDYSILPLKVFDREGRGSYWDVLCAMSYVKQLNQNGANISIVNASFGGNMPRNVFDEPGDGEPKNVFAQMLDDLNEMGTLVITSAGNTGDDNDIGLDGDFLSSFQSSNILAVGGYNYDTINPASRPIRLHPLSNFGSNGSVDIALAFNDYKIIFETDDPDRKQRVTLQGTSYAAAAMSGIAGSAINIVGKTSPEDLKNFIFNQPAVEEASQLRGKIKEGRVLPRAERQ